MAASMPCEDQPEHIPARMVNEYSYCPRLFYLEWVQSRFEDNAYTSEGRWVHRRVDVERGNLGDDHQEGKITSLLLSSNSLGAVCKTDLVEVEGGVAVPVDYKRGSPPDVPAGAHEPELVQLCLQGLLLREEGYESTRGELYFAETKTRVSIEFDEDLIARTKETIRQARDAAALDEAPPPLVDSPKCPNCSLVGLCLPDETNALRDRSSEKPRRLTPSDTDARPLYVTKQGARLGKSKNRITVKYDGKVIESVRPRDVSQIATFGNVQISSQLIRFCLSDGIPICWFSYGGWFTGMAFQPSVSHVQLRIHQVAKSAQGDLGLAQKLIETKIHGCRVLLMRNSNSRPTKAIDQLGSLMDKVGRTDSIASLLGIEGTAARIYFSNFSGMLKGADSLPGETFDFDGRNRRPPRDAVNCLLSYCYSLLIKDVTATLYGVGFDPSIGVLHKPRFGRPALALDLAEEFRSLIAESVVLRLINNRELKPSDFVVRVQGVVLTTRGRRQVLDAYERRLAQELTHPTFGYKVSYRRVIEVQARVLAATMLGEVEQYEGLRVR